MFPSSAGNDANPYYGSRMTAHSYVETGSQMQQEFQQQQQQQHHHQNNQEFHQPVSAQAAVGSVDEETLQLWEPLPLNEDPVVELPPPLPPAPSSISTPTAPEIHRANAVAAPTNSSGKMTIPPGSKHVKGLKSAKSMSNKKSKRKSSSNITDNSNNKDNTNSSSNKFTEIVDRILIAAETRQALLETTTNGIFDGKKQQNNQHSHDHSTIPGHSTDGGPLTSQELSQLGVLCASSSPSSSSSLQFNPASPSHSESAVAAPPSADLMNETKKTQKVSWAGVEGDSLATLVPMLEAHAVAASNVDLVGEGLQVLDAGALSIDQWMSTKRIERRNGGSGSLAGHKSTLYTNSDSSTQPSHSVVTLGFGYKRLCILQRGLEAASVLLSIMACPGVDARAISEDAIEACVSLLKQHLSRNIIPSLSETSASHDASSSTGSSSTKRGKSKKGSHQATGTSSGASSSCKHVTSLKNGGMRRICKAVLATVGALVGLMDRFDQLIQAIQLDDRPTLMLTSVALSTLLVETSTGSGVASLGANLSALCLLVQMAAMRMVVTAFRRYPRHRSVVLEDLFPLMLKLPTSKRSLRTFRLRLELDRDLEKEKKTSSSSRGSHTPLILSSPAGKGTPMSPFPDACSSPVAPNLISSSSIQQVTALILNLIQSCVVMPHPIPSNKKDAKKEDGIPASLPKLTSGVAGCVSVCDFLTSQMLRRCSKKGGDGGASEFRPILHNLVDDLLLVQLLPEYPAADMLLMSLSKRLGSDLLSSSRGGGGANNNGTAITLEPTYVSTAMDVLGKICAATAGHLLYHRNFPFQLPKAVDDKGRKSDAAPLNDANEINRCFCGRVNLVDTFMLDCDRCHAWFHGSCVGVTKDRLPPVWICDECTMQLTVQEQTNAFASRYRSKVGSGISGGDAGGDSLEKIPSSDEVFEELEDTHIFRQLLLNYLRCLSESTLDVKDARECHLARWIQECEERRGSKSKAKESDENDTAGERRYFAVDLMRSHFLEQWTQLAAPKGQNAPLPIPVGSSSSSPQSFTSCPKQLSAEGNAKVMRTLEATSSELSKAFPRMLMLLLRLMGDDDMVSLRKLSVKALSQVIRVDPMIMLQPTVQNAVSRRFVDEAISVREAAVALVGSYVLQSPKVANAFHTPLLARLNDVGVSVRRRSVRIFRDILLTQPKYGGRAAACSVMLQRAANPKEEDSIRDLIQETFKQLWFDDESPLGLVVVNDVSDSDGATNCNGISKQHGVEGGVSGPVVTPMTPVSSDLAKKSSENDDVTPLPASESRTKVRRRKSEKLLEVERRRKRCSAAASQMVDVVVASGNADFLSWLVKDLFFGFGEGDKDSKITERIKRRDAAEDHCCRIVSALIEDLLSSEERRAGYPSGSEEKKQGDQRLVALLLTLGVFCESSPSLLASHLDTILPYLKADNLLSMADEAKILSTVSRIITVVSPVLAKADLTRLSEGQVGDDLVRVTYKFGTAATAAAVEALLSLCRNLGFEGSEKLRKKVMKLAWTFYMYLYKQKDVGDNSLSSDKGAQNNIRRALTVLGSICEHREKDGSSMAASLEENSDLSSTSDYFAAPSLLQWENLSDCCFAAFTFYLKKRDVSTKCAALRALTRLFIARPRVMLALEQEGVIEDIMSQSSHSQLQLEALRCWADILISEDKRVESGDAKQSMEQNSDITVSRRISGDQDGDASIAGSVLTQHARRLYQLTTSRIPEIRLAVVDLLGHLLQQGLINPMETVPYLLALQGDVGNPSIRSLSLQLLIAEGEKRPDMLRQRVCAGVREAYRFQRLVNPRASDVTAVVFEESSGDDSGEKTAQCIFASIYKESLSGNKGQKQALFKSLLGLFTDALQERRKPTADNEGGSSSNSRKRNRNLMSGRKKYQDETLLEKLPLLSYAAQILAHLPYTAGSDPLFIIYHVSCICSVRGAQLFDKLRSFLVLHVGKDEDDENVSEDEVEKSAKMKNPENAKGVSFMNDKKFDLEKFAMLCTEAAALVLLMRLRVFLKKVYNLSEVRCIEFNPNEKETIGDRSISIPEKMPIFDNRVGRLHEKAVVATDENDRSKEKSGFDKSTLIRQYADFRFLMRATDVDLSRVVIAPPKSGRCEDSLSRLKATTNKKRGSTSKKSGGKRKKRRKIADEDGDESDEEW